MNDNINATKNITQDAATAMIQSMTVEQLQVFMQMISQAIMAQQAPQTGAVEPVVNPEPVPKQMSPEEEMEEFVNRTGSEMLDIDMQKTKFEKVRLMDFSEIKTREDIMNDFLYDAIYSDDVRESDLIKIVSELKVIAKKIGGRELESDVKEICRVRKKDLQRKIKKKHEAKNKKQKDEDYKSFEESYSTEFSDLPEFSTGNRVCGFRFKADDSGIYEIDDSGDINSIGYKILCRTPVLINRVILPDEGYYDGAEKKFEIIYRDNHGWHKKILAQDVLFNSSKIDILIKDIGFEKEISKKLSAYFIDTYELSIRSGKLPEVTAFSKFGFSHDMQRFYPYVDEPLMDSESEFKKLVKALQPHGDENLWFEAMRKMRATKIHMLNFAIAGALSAPLIGLLKMEGFTCNIYGNKEPENLFLVKLQQQFLEIAIRHLDILRV